MGITLAFYLLRSFFTRFALTLGGLGSVLLVFDLMANSDSVLTGDRIFLPLFYYGLLRLPEIVALILPLAALIAALLSLGRLAMRQELISAMAGGMSPAHLTGIMIIAGLMLAGAEFFVLDQMQPESTARLHHWSQNDYHGLPDELPEQRRPTWFSDGRTLLYAGGIGMNGRKLQDVIVVQRKDNGLIEAYFQATEARYHHHMIELINVRRYSPSPTIGAAYDTHLNAITLPLSIRPAELGLLTDNVDEMNFKELRSLSRNAKGHEWIDNFYQTALQRRLTQPISVPAMMLFALPLVMQLPRRGNIQRAQGLILIAGFLYLVSERLLLAFGETGAISPAMAAWSPPLIAAAASGLVLHYLQHPRVRRRPAASSPAADVA